MTNAEREAATATALVEAARRGDEKAFDALVRRYRKRIYALALHMTRSASEADDIAQEVFLKAHRAPRRGHDRRPASRARRRSRCARQSRPRSRAAPNLQPPAPRARSIADRDAD